MFDNFDTNSIVIILIIIVLLGIAVMYYRDSKKNKAGSAEINNLMDDKNVIDLVHNIETEENL